MCALWSDCSLEGTNTLCYMLVNLKIFQMIAPLGNHQHVWALTCMLDLIICQTITPLVQLSACLSPHLCTLVNTLKNWETRHQQKWLQTWKSSHGFQIIEINQEKWSTLKRLKVICFWIRKLRTLSWSTRSKYTSLPICSSRSSLRAT